METIEVTHPTTGETVNALVVGKVFDDNGRYIGQKLRFPGDAKPVEMTFAEIYRLRSVGAAV